MLKYRVFKWVVGKTYSFYRDNYGVNMLIASYDDLLEEFVFYTTINLNELQQINKIIGGLNNEEIPME